MFDMELYIVVYIAFMLTKKRVDGDDTMGFGVWCTIVVEVFMIFIGEIRVF